VLQVNFVMCFFLPRDALQTCRALSCHVSHPSIRPSLCDLGLP